MLLLFGVAALIAVRLDRPDREQRSVAELLALAGALLAAAALLVIPGLAGHAGQTPPAAVVAGARLDASRRRLAVARRPDRDHPARLAHAGRQRRLAVLGPAVPRFSLRGALVSVIVLIASGVGAAIVHLPTLSSLWQTSYGKTILVKVALPDRHDPRRGDQQPPLGAAAEGGAARATTPDGGARAIGLLRRTVGVEIVLVLAIVLAAMVLTSLPPPARALAEVGGVDAHVGPGAVATTVDHGAVHAPPSPSRRTRRPRPTCSALHLTRSGAPVHGRDRDPAVPDARHGDGHPELPDARALARGLPSRAARRS